MLGVMLIVRVVLGFAIAAIAAGLTMVLFVTTPVELATSPGDADALGAAALLALAVATHAAVFSAPFALVAVAVGERRSIRSWVYYALAGIAIASLGFLAQYSSEVEGPATIFNAYALVAFLTTGLVAGIVFWLLCGRYAGAAGDPKGALKATAKPAAPRPSAPPPPEETPSTA
jgi:hypothetical protein